MWLILAMGCADAGTLHLRGVVEASGPMVVEVRRLDGDMDVLASAATEASGRFELEVGAVAEAPTDSPVLVAVVAWSDGDGNGARGPSDTPVGVLADRVLFYAAAAGPALLGVPVEARAGWNVAVPPTPGRIVGKAAKGVVDVVVPANVALREPAVSSLRVRLAGTAWSCVGVEAPKFEGGRGAGSGLLAGVTVGPDGGAVIDLPEEPPWSGFPMGTIEMTYGRLVAWQADSCDRYDPMEDEDRTWMAPLVVHARASEPDDLWLSVYPHAASPNRWTLVGEGAQPIADELVLDAR